MRFYDQLKPRQYLIFNAHKADRRVYWNYVITIGDLRYRMIGVAKHSPGHFFGDVFDPRSEQWIHFNSLLESLEIKSKGFTLEPLGNSKTGKIDSIEGLIPGSSYVHYIQVN